MKVKDLNGSFIDLYIERMVQSLTMINPNWKDKDIEKEIKKMIEENGQNIEVYADNNYTGESRDTTILSILDWFVESDDIIAGNMTFYKNHFKAKNPNAHMLQNLLTKRKQIKKNMWKYIETDPRKYADEDRRQGNVKKLANSYYGGSGAQSSSFYSKHSGPATTTTAQNVISTAENMFEGFVADNYNFMDLNELFEWLYVVANTFKDIELDSWIDKIKRDELKERLYEKIIHKKENDSEIINRIVNNMDGDFVTYVYYKNNIFEFIERNEKIQKTFYKVFKTVLNYDYVNKKDKDWEDKIPKDLVGKFESADKYNKFVNRTYFMDPNEPPEEIIKYLDELKDMMMKYIYTPYLGYDRIYRLKNYMRKCVTVIDTDSNILSMDPLVDFIDNIIVKGETFGRDSEKNTFIMINTLTYILTAAITKQLLLYGEYSNVPEEYRPLYNMKNEFF